MKRALFVAAVGLMLSVTARANAPDEPGTMRVPVGQGQALIIGAPRQLTLNAHVRSVLVQPGNLEAAYSGATQSGDTVTAFVRLVGFRTGQTWTLAQATSTDTPDSLPSFYDLIGWSSDGRYLLVSHEEQAQNLLPPPPAGENPDRTSPEADDEKLKRLLANRVTVYDSVDMGVEPFKVRRIPLPANAVEGAISPGAVQVSPSGNLLAIAAEGADNADAKAALPLLICDVTRRSTRRVSLPAGFYMVGWDDETHLLLCHSKGRVFQYGLLDTVTGPAVLISHARFLGSPPARAFPNVSLTLQVPFAALPALKSKETAEARSLWLNIAQGKRDLATVCLAVTLSGYDFSPQLVPNQSAALWVANGDLYASTFAVDAATARERYDAGDDMTCDEERGIAEDNAKQLGLGLIEYTQDYDEQFPPAANFHDGVYPYIKNDSLFRVRQYPFQYAAPADLHLSSIDDVSHTVLGTIQLPCATVTLYADGHVRSLPRLEPGTLAP